MPGIDQYAMKIATDAATEDGGTKNAVLIECGMHSREWFAAESCYWLIDWFVDNLGTAAVDDLLADVDVWILPQTNPAGRDLDDPALGDPTAFVNVCKGGTNEGDVCATDADCNSNDCYGSGWRTNANTSGCAVGIDLARNWSSGWNSAAATCDPSQFMKYRGPDPFSEVETRNLRRFVHNHMISEVLIAHTTGQETWNLWAGSSAANDFMVDELESLNATGVGADTEAAMPRSSVGGGVGQYSAWLAQPSNVAGELDEGTERNISTFFFELPICGSSSCGSAYYNDDYDGDDYQFTSGDGSNSFHPSSTVWYRLWEDSVLPMMQYVIRQAGSPQCPLDASFTRLTAECEADSFGLVGMKVAPASNLPGSLDYDSATREETLTAGTYEIVYAVQNFSSNVANSQKDLEVRVFQDGVLQTTHPDSVTLAVGARDTLTLSHTFVAGHTYWVEIELDGDDFTNDNRKSMAFRVDAALPPAPFARRHHLLEKLVIQPGDDDSLTVIEGTLRDERFDLPRRPEIALRIAALPAHRGLKSRAARIVRNLRVGAKDPGLRIAKNRLDFTAKGRKNPLAAMHLESDPSREGETRIRILIRDKEFRRAQAKALTTSIRLRIGDRLELAGIAYDRSQIPPPVKRDRGEDELEDEPSAPGR